MHDRRQPAQRGGGRHHHANHDDAERRLGHQRRDDRGDGCVVQVAPDGVDPHHVTAAKRRDRVRADAGQVRPDGRKQRDPALGEGGAENAAPHAGTHQQAQQVQQQRDRQRQQTGIAEPIAEGGCGVAKLGQRVRHLLASCARSAPRTSGMPTCGRRQSATAGGCGITRCRAAPRSTRSLARRRPSGPPRSWSRNRRRPDRVWQSVGCAPPAAPAPPPHRSASIGSRPASRQTLDVAAGEAPRRRWPAVTGSQRRAAHTQAAFPPPRTIARPHLTETAP